MVDNASTDGTPVAVQSAFPDVRLITLDANYGGAGGFAYGMALALADGADVLWLMDDDTVPAPALSKPCSLPATGIPAARRRSSPARCSGRTGERTP